MAVSLMLRDVEITRIWESIVPFPREMVFPETDKQLWQASRDWLTPYFWEPDSDNMLVAMQSRVIRSAGRTILVDTGVGNNKDRPGMAMFDHHGITLATWLVRRGVNAGRHRRRTLPA